LEFVPARWRPYVTDNPDPMKRRHYFELCVLWELQGALRVGDVWLEGSRRYADPETYLILGSGGLVFGRKSVGRFRPRKTERIVCASVRRS